MLTEAEKNEVIGTDELAQMMDSRAATYNLLARLYRVEVDEPLLEKLRTSRFPLRTGNKEINLGYKLMREYLGSSWENAKTELGHGNTAYSCAYPYESVYTSGRRLLMQDARDEVVLIYRSAGKDKAPDWTDPEDHIALELEFQGFLCTKAAEALRAGNEDEAAAYVMQQRNFLEDHLLSWTPMMLADLDRFSRTDFYKGLGHLTTGVLQEERSVLEELLGAEDDEEAEKE